MPGEAMNDEQKRELLELWRGKAYLEYHEAVSLLSGYFPGIRVNFAEEESSPGRLKLLVQVLNDDIQQFTLRVYFDVWHEYRREIHLDEPDFATPDTLNHFIPSGNMTSWWIYGKLSAAELREWAQNKGIANAFLGTTASPSPDSLNDRLPEPLSKSAPAVNPVASPASSIVVPRDLWEGKRPTAIRDGLRESGYADPVIAYVLFNWCGQTNKTQLGRLLGKPDLIDSSYFRLTDRLLAETASFTITHD
jgi:hypothetical protein